MAGVAATLHLLVIEDADGQAVAVEGSPRDALFAEHLVNPTRVVIDLALPGLSHAEVLVQLSRPRGCPDTRPEVAVVVTEARAPLSRARAVPKCADTIDPWSTLTSAEVEVTLLAAAGLTNRQIAQKLFTSPRTTESHLAHVYRKLGISGRTQLAAETARRGL